MTTSKEKLMQIANALELLQNTLKCVICLEMLREPVSTRCGHHFCTLCLNNLLKLKTNGRATCPLCSTVISRRGIVENDKIRRHVDGVTRVIKAIKADTGMDITLLRQNPSSTFEANSPTAGPSAKQNQNQIEDIPLNDSDAAQIEDSKTPKASPPMKLSSAEKVKTWLIQNDNDFNSKAILNEFTNPSKQSPCYEDSDEMISVSQIPPRTTDDCSKDNNETVENVGRPAARRSLKIKEINLLTSGIAKSTDNAFDKLLKDSGKGSSSKSKVKSVVSNVEKNYESKKQMSQNGDKSKNISEENIFSNNSHVVLDLMEPCTSQPSKSDAPPVLEDKDTQEPFSPDEEMPELEPMSITKNTAQQSKKTTSSESQLTSLSGVGSCELIPPSECAGEVPIMNLKHTLKKSDEVKESKKKPARLTNVEKQVVEKKVTNQKVTKQLPKRRSLVGDDALSKASQRCNVSFLQLGRVLRERRLLPVGIRCHCINSVMFLLDLNDSSPQPSRVPPTCELAGVDENAMDTAMDTPAVDTVSEDMFPISPDKIVQSGGVIAKRRSNNSSIVGDDILDAATVVFTQPPIARSLTYHDMDNTLLESEKTALESPSESLLSKKSEVAEAAGPSGKSDSDEELIAIRKSTKRPRRLSSSDESDCEKEKSVRKKKKTSPSSNSRRKSIDFMQEELPLHQSLLDQTIESPQRLVRGIKAKIAAGMLNTTDDLPRRTSPRASPRNPRANRQTPKLHHVDLTTPPRKKPSSDSDISDCEILEGTPQQETSINISRRSMQPSERSFSGKALDTTVVQAESCTPGFVEPSQPPGDDLLPSFDPKKLGIRTSGKTNMEEEGKKDVGSPAANRKRAQKSVTPQRPLREKNTTEERATNKTLNNISMTSAKEDRLAEKKIASPRSVQKQPPKIQSPHEKDLKLCFVCSGLAGNFTALVQKLAAMVGADFSSKFDAKATHLIVKTKEDNTTDKTLKYLCAVAAKKWVVSFQWVVEGIKEGKLLPEEKFEVLDTTGAAGPRLSRLSPKLLFSGFEFCVFPPLSDITKQQLEELVQICGASVVSDPKQFSFGQDVLPLCLAEYEEEREQDYAGWIDRYCVPLVQHEWILDCIGRFSLVSFWSLLMSDVSDDNLRSMGYPPYLIEHPPSDSTEME